MNPPNSVSASVLPDYPIHYSKPPTIHDDAKSCLHRAAVILNRLMNNKSLPDDVRGSLRSALREVESAQDIVMGELPGLEATKKPKSKATAQEVVAFIQGLNCGLNIDDAHWFFYKCEGSGWKNAGKPIKDWRATVRAWHLARVFPSQKLVNGKLSGGMKPLNIAEKESARLLKESDKV